jgi:hypothetical protein
VVLLNVGKFVVKHLPNPESRYEKRKPLYAEKYLEGFGARHTGHLVFARTVNVVVSLEKLATALDNAVHALADSHLLQKALSVNFGLLAQVSHAEVQLKQQRQELIDTPSAGANEKRNQVKIANGYLSLALLMRCTRLLQ